MSFRPTLSPLPGLASSGPSTSTQFQPFHHVPAVQPWLHAPSQHEYDGRPNNYYSVPTRRNEDTLAHAPVSTRQDDHAQAHRQLKRSASPPSLDHEGSFTFSAPDQEGMQSVRPSARNAPPRKRNRLALSCTHCRDRKIRCSREIPCEQCIKRGEEDSCHVEHFKHRAAEERAARVRGETEAAVLVGNNAQVQTLQRRIEQLEHDYELERLRVQEMEAALQHDPAPTTSNGATYQSPPADPLTEYHQVHDRLCQLAKSLTPDQLQIGGSVATSTPSASRDAYSSRSSDRHLSTPSVRQSSATSDVSIAKRPEPATDAENAVAMLETLVSAADVAGPAPKIQGRMVDRIAVCKLVHEHNTTWHRRPRTSPPSPLPASSDHRHKPGAPRRALSGLAGSHTSLARMERPYPPIVNPALAQPSMASNPLPPCRKHDESKMDDTPSSFTSTRSACSARSPADTPTTDPDAEGGPAEACDEDGTDLMSYLGARHNGLLKVYNGSETKLGFGIGWTFAAAAENGEYEAIRQSYADAGKGLGDGYAEREAILRTVLRTLPTRQVTEEIFDSYESRANFIHTRAIHVGQLKRELDTLLACPDDASKAHVLNVLDPGWLALLLMVLVLGLKFFPCPDAEKNNNRLSMGLLNASCTMNCWYSSAKTIVSMLGYGITNPTLSLIQALLCIDLHGAEDESTMQWLQKAAQHASRVLGIDRLGARPEPNPTAGDGEAETEQEMFLRYEMSKRVWWALVSRDWYAAQIAGLLYNIIPDQFSTPKPGNYNDSDLEALIPSPPRPDSEYTDTSYALARAALGNTIRKHTDLINQRANETGINAFLVRLSSEDVDHIDASYRSLLEVEFPPFYWMKNHTTPRPSVAMERALLHNIVFSQLLRLHRFSLSSRPDESLGVGGRDTCVLLARSMLNALGTLQQGITAIGRLWCLRGHMFQAAAVLVLDLCRRPQSPAERSEIRKQVMTAVMALRFVLHYNPPVKRSLRILLALLAEEDAQWKERLAAVRTSPVDQQVTLPPRPCADTMVSLTMRIKDVISPHYNSEFTPGESDEMEKAVAYVASAAAADLSYSPSTPSTSSSITTPKPLKSTESTQHDKDDAGASPWFSLPSDFGIPVPALAGGGSTQMPIPFMPGGMPNLGWVRPSSTLLPPVSEPALERLPTDASHSTPASARDSRTKAFTAVPAQPTSNGSVVPPAPSSLPSAPNRLDEQRSSEEGPTNVLAVHQLFRPGQRSGHTEQQMGNYANTLPSHSLGGTGDGFDLSAFVLQHSQQPPQQHDLPVPPAPNLSGSHDVRIDQHNGYGLSVRSLKGLVPSVGDMAIPPRPFSSPTGPTGLDSTPELLTSSQPGHNHATQLPSCMLPGPGGPLGFSGPMGPVASSATLGVTPEDATSLDSFWRWILDQGGVCPSSDPSNPLA